MEAQAKTAMQYIEDRRDLIVGLSDRVWELAELSLQEHESAACLAEALRGEGFTITEVEGLPAAFVAEWGSGEPILGFLGEYDALPGVSQKAQVEREELVPRGAGHACGHNLLGAASFGAAIALKKEMEAGNLPGTIRFYGCPAEEAYGGKVFMAREGLFDDCDVCLTWHPGSINRVRTGSSLAIDGLMVTFHGRTAHASGDPYNGRSALDAVQLMNMGIEFMREHMPPDARIHYTIVDGGRQPNVVPAVASEWLYVRGPEKSMVVDLNERVINCAEGAAKMTDTTVDVEVLSSLWHTLNNRTLENMILDCMNRVGRPQFSSEDRELAEEFSRTVSMDQKKASLRKQGLDPEEYAECGLHESILEDMSDQEPGGSTDVADVSWCCPTAQFSTACAALGTPGHSWQLVAQAGMGIGHEGMLAAARIMAEAGLALLADEELRARAKKEFEERTGGIPYTTSLPDEIPNFYLERR